MTEPVLTAKRVVCYICPNCNALIKPEDSSPTPTELNEFGEAHEKAFKEVVGKTVRHYKHREGWKQSEDKRGKWKRPKHRGGYNKLKETVEEPLSRGQHGTKQTNRVFGDAEITKCGVCFKRFFGKFRVRSLAIHMAKKHNIHPKYAVKEDNDEVEGKPDYKKELETAEDEEAT
jgi:hypothetical protein